MPVNTALNLKFANIAPRKLGKGTTQRKEDVQAWNLVRRLEQAEERRQTGKQDHKLPKYSDLSAVVPQEALARPKEYSLLFFFFPSSFQRSWSIYLGLGAVIFQ